MAFLQQLIAVAYLVATKRHETSGYSLDRKQRKYTQPRNPAPPPLPHLPTSTLTHTLTPNFFLFWLQFDKLADQLLALPMDSLKMLEALVQAVFDKALDEPTFVDMYADLCVRLNMQSSSWSFVKVSGVSIPCMANELGNETKDQSSRRVLSIVFQGPRFSPLSVTIISLRILCMI